MSRPKLPTDRQIIKGFGDYEKGMNVLLACLRDVSSPESAGKMDIVFSAHDVYRELAIEAQARLDKKAEKKGRGK